MEDDNDNAADRSELDRGADGEAAAANTEELHTAERALQQARDQLRRAEEVYVQVKQRAVEEAERVRDSSVGENLDRALDVVRRHPGLGVLVAAAFGFFLGKLFRR